MQFKIKNQKLLTVIKKLIKINPNNLNEKQKNIKFEVSSEKITIYSFNEKMFLQYYFDNKDDIEITSSGTFLINLKILYDIISKIKDEWIAFTLQINNLIISNFDSNNSFIFKLNTIETETFPEINFNHENYQKITLAKNFINDLINQLAFVVDINNTSNILRGVNFLFENSNGLVTATDRISMAQKKLSLSNHEINHEITIPIALLNDIDKVTNELETTCHFYFNKEDNLIIAIDNFAFKGRLINGFYPKIQTLIKNFLQAKDNQVIVINNLKKFLNTIELAIVLTKKDMVPLVELTFDQTNNKIVINCVSNNHSYGEIDGQFTDFKVVSDNKENLTIVFNYYLLTYALKAFNKCQTVNLNISLNKHTIITSHEDPNLTQLVLPIIKN